MKVEAESLESGRLDKWLWAVRVFKTRPLATEACRAGGVRQARGVAKASHGVKLGEVFEVGNGLERRILLVKGVPKTRVGAALVENYCEDQTPPEIREAAKAKRETQPLKRERGSGRPTKRDRRLLDDLLGP